MGLEGDEQPRIAKLTPLPLVAPPAEVINENNIEVEFTDQIKAYGTSSGGKIQIKSNENEATQFTTLLHEWAHELLEHKGSSQSKEEKEIEAETCAYIVCRRFGKR